MKQGDKVIFVHSCDCGMCDGVVGAIGVYERKESSGHHFIKTRAESPPFVYHERAFMLLKEFFNEER